MWEAEKRVSCEVCGTREEEWEEEGEDGKVRPVHAYYPHVFVCPGCKSVGEAYEAVSKSAGKNHSTHGAKVRLVTAEARKQMIQDDALARAKSKENQGLSGGGADMSIPSGLDGKN